MYYRHLVFGVSVRVSCKQASKQREAGQFNVQQSLGNMYIEGLLVKESSEEYSTIRDSDSYDTVMI